MQDSLKPLEQALRERGFSVTDVRKSVFTTLQNNGPLSMAELYKKSGASIDRSSVYRTVSLFERVGIINRLQIGWKYKLELSDQFQHHHHHLTCLHCGTITTLHEDTKIEAQLSALAKTYDFAMQGHMLEISGLCQNCRAT